MNQEQVDFDEKKNKVFSIIKEIEELMLRIMVGV